MAGRGPAMSALPRAFSFDVLLVPLDKILPSRMLPSTVPGSAKYKQVLSSIGDVGVIEPLPVVARLLFLGPPTGARVSF